MEITNMIKIQLKKQPIFMMRAKNYIITEKKEEAEALRQQALKIGSGLGWNDIDLPPYTDEEEERFDQYGNPSPTGEYDAGDNYLGPKMEESKVRSLITKLIKEELK